MTAVSDGVWSEQEEKYFNLETTQGVVIAFQALELRALDERRQKIWRTLKCEKNIGKKLFFLVFFISRHSHS